MAAIKLHSYRGKNDGSISCDFRGDKFIGHEQGDEHHTLYEIDPASDDLIHEVLRLGPDVNRLFKALRDAQVSATESALDVLGEGDGPVGLRIGIWDE